jgi:hypothetical protein
MLVALCVHSGSAALHYQLGSGQLGSGQLGSGLAAAVHVIQASHSLSVLDSASGHMTVEP